ncbi:5' nucleotidase, NT5C type [Sinomonas soli]
MTMTIESPAHMGPMNTALAPRVVLVDMDGVLFDWMTGLNAKHLELDPAFPVIRPGDQHTWDMLCGPTGDRDILRRAMDAPGLYRDLQPMPGALDALEAMEAAGLAPFLCSAPFPTHATCTSEKLASVQEHFGPKWAQRTILTLDKTLVHGAVLVDDKPVITGARTPEWTQVVFDQPYNQGTPGPRLHSWEAWEDVVLPVVDAVHALT